MILTVRIQYYTLKLNFIAKDIKAKKINSLNSPATLVFQLSKLHTCTFPAGPPHRAHYKEVVNSISSSERVIANWVYKTFLTHVKVNPSTY